MEISREAAEIVQEFFPIEELAAFLELETAPGSNWGQTFFILHPSGLWALTRTSYAEPCRKIRLDHRAPLQLRRRQFEDVLEFTDDGGTQLTVRLYPANVAPTQEFVARVAEFRDRLPEIPQEPEPRQPVGGAQKARSSAKAPKTTSSVPPEAVRGDPVAMPGDPMDFAGHAMQNFFERIIERLGDAPPEKPPAQAAESLDDAPSADFLRLVDTGDVFARIPTKTRQAAEAYMAAWEKRPDPAVALKLADLHEKLAAPDAQLVWLERAAAKTPAGPVRNAIIDKIVFLLEQQGKNQAAAEWKAQRSPS